MPKCFTDRLKWDAEKNPVAPTVRGQTSQMYLLTFLIYGLGWGRLLTRNKKQQIKAYIFFTLNKTKYPLNLMPALFPW